MPKSRVVSLTTPDTLENKPYKQRPQHHTNETSSGFVNPWPSFNAIGPAAMIKALRQYRSPVIPPDIAQLIPVHKPNWDATAENSKIQATWLGHASFLIELPAPNGAARGPRILTDPVFVERCSPVQFMGPKRYTKAPCQVEDLPELDLVLVSHDHYDHMDTTTLTGVERKVHPYFISPLGNKGYFMSLGVPTERCDVLDWWQSRDITLELPSVDGLGVIKTTFRVTCVPSQHQTNRGVFDRNKTLWGGFAIESLPSSESENRVDKGFKVYFAGDTGYRYVPDGTNEDERPHCPVFEEIGNAFGGFDLALIPIGAYQPREFMSSVHIAPQDSVRIFKDVKAKNAIAMHWGTWVLTSEPVTEPPEKLAQECKKIGIADGLFRASELGETLTVDI